MEGKGRKPASGTLPALEEALQRARRELAVLREHAAPECGGDHFATLGALLEELRALEARILGEAETALMAHHAARQEGGA